ncbi:uncharacterized protein RJT20DRAFT_54137 [Scheffersomyces xylosifermentans]|uniref:uncharacterized protein n=1 Tax=Scheffersomyces xylosifermentans TaxID=1304137 RepID=UPI00315DA8FA
MSTSIANQYAIANQYRDQKLPTYIPNPNISVNTQRIYDYQPQYFDVDNVDFGNGWRFMICNKVFSQDLTVFVSSDSIGKYKAFKKTIRDGPMTGAAKYARDLQFSGIGVPLLKVDSHTFHLNKFLTIQKYYIDQKKFGLRGFDPSTDLYDFCVVNRFKHGSYTSYEMNFTPDPNDRRKDFQIVVFAHSILPIADYVYNGNRYRWIREGRNWSFEFNYSNFLLDSKQHALSDNWNKKTNKLESSIDPNNPLVGGFFGKFFSIKSRTERECYYSSMRLGSLDEKRTFSIFGDFKQKAQYTMGDIYNTDNIPVNYESIHSVNLDALTRLCMGLLFKREEDIKDRNN